MNLGGYTGIPDTLPEAQAMIVNLCDSIKKASRASGETLNTLDQAVAMIEAARKALNAVEAPSTDNRKVSESIPSLAPESLAYVKLAGLFPNPVGLAAALAIKGN